MPDLTEIQIASIGDLASAIGRLVDGRGGDGAHLPAGVARTPQRVPFAEVFTASAYDERTGWRLPVGIDSRTLQNMALQLPPPSGALILGDRGTGKSDLLLNIARCALGIDGPVEVHAISATRSPLLSIPGLTSATTLDDIEGWMSKFSEHTDRARLVLIDDADRLHGPSFDALAAVGDPRTTVVAAGRIRELEAPTHWSAPLRRSKAAVILRPLPGDGAIFDLQLRVGPSHLTPGRGVLIDGDTVVPILVAEVADHVNGGVT